MTAALAPTAVLDAADWQARRRAHEERVDAWLTPHLARRRRGEKHPVEDFLFTYYSHRPAQLRRWHPGAGTVLRDADPAEFGRDYRPTAGGVTLDTAALRARRADSVDWIRSLLTATAGRPGHFGCFGMHEWAMVYRQTQAEVRHNAWPLRLSPEQTARTVEANRIRCSHFDAYRFFTAPARPLNLLTPTRETQHAHEQPGCLHANMDLYKWAYKLSPLVPSELVADCFELAREIRTLDMRASPYDLAALGYRPVRVETAEGRAEYVTAQRGFAERAARLRERLLAAVPDERTELGRPSAEVNRPGGRAGRPAGG
ncbi:3-methyladenine DNA glycosylase [Micromonospora echinaurantiaca]|uniref:3-methyladenine DNA glycosylase n=1 Tax=Micromonospora echinaurantiaca TaxID=47857 RepID=UPI00341AE907